MKRRVVLLFILAIYGFLHLSAQNPNLEKLNAYKIAFFTRRLNFTSQEAEKFWPVYNEYQAEKNKLQRERQELNRLFSQKGPTMSDRELIETGDRLIGLEVKEAELAMEFHNNIKGILPPVKVLRLYQAENLYRVQLLNELQERRPLRNY